MNLLLFLSDRCNMSCDYCFLDLNGPSPVVLSPAAARRACADHLRRRGPAASFTFLGGEPLAHYPLLFSVAEFIQTESAGKASMRLVTNGTLLTAARQRELKALGVRVTVSLDGPPSVHDRHRALRAGGPSALAKSLAALEHCDLAELSANMVLCADTAGRLLSGIEFLRAFGLRRISFHADATGAWDDAGLTALRGALAGLEEYLRIVPPGALELTHLGTYAGASLSAEHCDGDLVLGADGRYYPCDGLFARPYASLSECVVGDALGGVDWPKRARLHAHARAVIHGLLGGAPHFTCAREAYFRALAIGEDPAAAVSSFHRADMVLGDGLRALAQGALMPS